MESQAVVNSDFCLTPTSNFVAPTSIAQQTTNRPFDWENTPKEIREMIFQALDDDDDDPSYWIYSRASPRFIHSPFYAWNNHLPPLLAAFHGLPRSYSQALGRFMGFNTPLHISLGCGDFKNWTRFELSFIQSIDLDATCRASFANYPLTFPDLSRLPNLHHVSLHKDFRSVGRPDGDEFVSSFPSFLIACRNLYSVKVTFPPSSESFERHLHRNISCLVKQIEKKVGVKGALVKTVAEIHDDGWSTTLCDVQHWEWIAEKGKSMDWSKKIGWTFDHEKTYHRRFGRGWFENIFYEGSSHYLEFQMDERGEGNFFILGPPYWDGEIPW